MSTISSAGLVAEIIKGDGHYKDDPIPHKIYSYKSQANETIFAVFYYEAHDDIHVSPFVREPVLLWSKKDKLTEEGRKFLGETGYINK